MIHLVYGQGGALLSGGMVALGHRIRREGYEVRDDLTWKYPQAVMESIQERKPEKVVLIGYSLGANCCTLVAEAYEDPIDLIVLYDPSVWSPVGRIWSNTKRTIHYQQSWSLLGRANVQVHSNYELIPTKVPHALVQSMDWLHQITMRALEDVYGRRT